MEDPNIFGHFDYKYLDHYWTEHRINTEGRRAFLVRVNESWGGFVLVNNFSMITDSADNSWNIAEFLLCVIGEGKE